jgi:hypothetical protein
LERTTGFEIRLDHNPRRVFSNLQGISTEEFHAALKALFGADETGLAALDSVRPKQGRQHDYEARAAPRHPGVLNVTFAFVYRLNGWPLSEGVSWPVRMQNTCHAKGPVR